MYTKGTIFIKPSVDKSKEKINVYSYTTALLDNILLLIKTIEEKKFL